MTPGERALITDALDFALEAHEGQTRKGTALPYSSHLLHVAALVQEHGGDPEQVAAALLHDTVEDCKDVTFARLEDRFGPGPTRIVRDCTDTEDGGDPQAKRPWRERKTEHLAHLRAAPARSLLVAACDKLHNLRSLNEDLDRDGPATLDRFNAPAPDQLWLFRTFLKSTGDRLPARLRHDLEEAVEGFEQRTAEP